MKIFDYQNSTEIKASRYRYLTRHYNAGIITPENLAELVAYNIGDSNEQR